MSCRVSVWQYECCGIDSYEDFSEAEEWKKTYTVNENNQQVTVNLKIPIACCKMTSSGDNVVDQRCAESPTDTNSNWKTVSNRLTSIYRLIIGWPSVLSVNLVYCGQTVGWIKMKLGMEVKASAQATLLDVRPSSQKGDTAAHSLTFRFMSIVAKLLNRSRCHLVWR